MYSTMDYSHFKIVYDFNPLTSLDLIPLSIDERVSFLMAMKRTSSEGSQWECTMVNIEKEWVICI